MIYTFKKFYKNSTIKQKLLLLFSVQIIIPMLFMSILLYANTYTIIENKCVSYSADVLKMIELRMSDFIQDIENASEDIVYDATAYKILQEATVGIGVEENASSDYIHNMLRKICRGENRAIQSIAIISNGNKRYSYDINAGRADIQNLLPYEKLLTQARNQNGSGSWYLEVNKTGRLTNVYFVRMIYDVDHFTEIGVLAMLINRSYLKNIYSDLSKEFMQSINILSEDNKWIMGNTDNWQESTLNIFALEGNKEWDYQIDRKEQKLIAYMKVDALGWKIVGEGALNKLINEELADFTLLFVIIMIFTILILSLFSILVALDFIEPISGLVKSIKKLEEENIYEEVIVNREDELGYLSKCFNKMSKQIDILLNQVYKERLTRKEAELKALQAQINPHFLFNTLESINWMAQLNNVPEIRDMVTSLGALMEAGMGKGNPLVPLSRELKYADSYILIMKNRYGERLRYDSEVDQSALSSKVPKLVLQPLIENAIYHGIDKTRQRCTISLSIQKEGGIVNVTIMDNGVGMSQEEVIQLNALFESDKDDYLLQEDRHGIGLKNVNRRIKLFFGQDYGLHIESEQGTYTKIKLSIPING